MHRRIMLGVGIAALAITLAACGSSSSGSRADHGSMPMMSKSATADHNSQDTMFAQMMIPHHAQAIDMAKLAATRASNADVKALATRIEGAQEPEITTMSGWLNSWGENASSTSMDMSSSHSTNMNSGMMSSADMTKLEGLSGTTFDRQFLTMMTQHHQGAIDMAKTEQASGKYQPARSLASDIIAAQSTEIAEMHHLLTTL